MDPSDELSLLVTRDLQVLEGWERYEVVTFLGAGGMGSVYKAFDPSLRRFVALKVLQRADRDVERRALQEARAQARVDHPNVCQVFEAGEVSGRPYIAMQYVDGEPLDEAAAGLPRNRMVQLVQEVAEAVHAAHRTGLIHRDLKPGNVLVARRGSGGLHPFVVDFGLAADLEEEDDDPSRDLVTGTPAYLAPEQVRGGPVDRRTDVYSLGVVLYELLAGRTPFAAAGLPETLRRIVHEEPAPPRGLDPAIPRDLETIALKCLAKDPARRYDSAGALAEDLRRFLDGEPILARTPRLGDRLAKRLRKNLALASVAAGAVLALSLLGAASLRSRWQAAERAELAQRFGQEVQEVEGTLRYAVLLPLHDTRAHTQALRFRMATIEEEMGRLGELARGPGHYALGQGHLALHEYEEARRHLERAWKAGYRRPEVAVALGRTLGYLYTRSVTESQVASGGPERDAFLREEERAYREPAVSYLREGAREGGPGADYVAGLLALYERRYPAALASARRAAAADPTLYEARQLEANVYLIQGDDALEAGRYAAALAFYDRADAVYAELLETVRSDAGLYAGRCGVGLQSVEVDMRVGRPPEADVARALTACGRALEADPDLAEAYGKEARIYWRSAERRELRGEDPRPDLARAVASARAAIERDPRDVNAYGHLSIAHRLLAAWQMSRGLDPSAALAAAIEAAGRAITLAPDRGWARNRLANAHLMRADLLLERGEDPRPELDRAAASYRRALALDPHLTLAFTNLGTLWKTRAEYEISLGLDPSESVSRAVRALQRALAINPNAASSWNNLGNAYLTLGDDRLARGEDPRSALEQAGRAYRRALEVNPEYGYAFYNLAFTERSLGEYELAAGRDPSEALASATRDLERAARLNPADADGFVELARIELLRARWARRAGGAGGAGAAVARGLAAGDRALRLNPRSAEALAVRGALGLVAARLAAAGPERRTRAARAAADLDRALALNPSLASTYRGPAAEARALAGG